MPRALLAACLLAGACSTVPPPAPEGPAVRDLRLLTTAHGWSVRDDGLALEVRVRAARSDSASSALHEDVLEVCAAVAPAVRRIVEPRTGAEEVLAALRLDYPGAVEELVLVPAYLWFWDPLLERWILICEDATRFEVQLGSRVVVEVTLRQTLS